MIRVSRYERQLNESILRSDDPPVAGGIALVLAADVPEHLRICEAAIWPALGACGYRAGRAAGFNSQGWLDDVGRQVRGADVIIADVSLCNADVMYVLGLCHGQGRCPLLISQNPAELSFNLEAFRCIAYQNDSVGLRRLREELGRVLRVFLASAERSANQGG